MAILSKGTDFSTGDQVTAAKLDALVDNATFASGAVDDSTTALDGNGKIIVKDGGITAPKLNLNDTGKVTIKGTGTIFPNSPENAYLQVSALDDSYVLSIDPNEIQSKRNLGLRCGSADAITLQNVNTAGDAAIVNMHVEEGKVGIGTDSPVEELHVSGSSGDPSILLENTSVGTSADTIIRSRVAGKDETGGRNFIYFGDAEDDNVGRITYQHVNDSMVFHTSAVEAMRINEHGNLVIANIPTSASGLSSGTVYSDSGTLKIVS